MFKFLPIIFGLKPKKQTQKHQTFIPKKINLRPSDELESKSGGRLQTVGNATLARINIDNSLFIKDFFSELLLLVGSKTLAIGIMAEAFILAQEHFLSPVNGRLIPLNEWQRFKWSDQLIKSGAAEVRETGVYIRGSNDQFAWLIQKQEAGKKSAIAKAHKKEMASTPVESRSTPVNGAQPLPLPLPLSLSQSLTLSQKQKHVKVAKAPEVYAYDFESLFQAYPKRKGDTRKEAGFNSLKEKITSNELFEQAKLAVKNYYGHCASEGCLKTSYVKQFGTFFGKGNPWREYIDYDPTEAARGLKSSAQSRDDSNQESLRIYTEKFNEGNL